MQLLPTFAKVNLATLLLTNCANLTWNQTISFILNYAFALKLFQAKVCSAYSVCSNNLHMSQAHEFIGSQYAQFGKVSHQFGFSLFVNCFFGVLHRSLIVFKLVYWSTCLFSILFKSIK